MDEMYRMLGKEREADLEREAQTRRRAAEVRGERRAPATAARTRTRWKRVGIGPARLIAFVVRVARPQT